MVVVVGFKYSGDELRGFCFPRWAHANETLAEQRNYPGSFPLFSMNVWWSLSFYFIFFFLSCFFLSFFLPLIFYSFNSTQLVSLILLFSFAFTLVAIMNGNDEESSIHESSSLLLHSNKYMSATFRQFNKILYIYTYIYMYVYKFI